MIVLGVDDTTLRDNMSSEEKLDLEKAIQMCRAAEIGKKYKKEFTANAEVSVVEKNPYKSLKKKCRFCRENTSEKAVQHGEQIVISVGDTDTLNVSA